MPSIKQSFIIVAIALLVIAVVFRVGAVRKIVAGA